jgi:hypothetical protein
MEKFEHFTQVIIMNDVDEEEDGVVLEQPLVMSDFIETALQDDYFRELLRKHGWVDTIQIAKDEKTAKFNNKFYCKDPTSYHARLSDLFMERLESDKAYRTNIFKSFIHGDLEVVRTVDFEASLSKELRIELSNLRAELHQKEKERVRKIVAERGEKEEKRQARKVANAKKVLANAGIKVGE